MQSRIKFNENNLWLILGSRSGDSGEHRLIIREKLDYCCVVYGSANSQLKSIDVVNEAMRIATGAFKTPIAVLHNLPNEPPLKYRRKELLVRTFFKYKCYLNNPAYSCIVDRRLEDFFFKSRLLFSSLAENRGCISGTFSSDTVGDSFSTQTVYN